VCVVDLRMNVSSVLCEIELPLDQTKEKLTTKTRRRKEKLFKRTAQCLLFSVFVSLWFSLPPYLIDRTSFYGGLGSGMRDAIQALGCTRLLGGDQFR